MVFTLGGKKFDLKKEDVVRKMTGVEPDAIQKHAVVIDKRSYPVKQVLSEVTGLPSTDFSTHQARNALKRLGLEVLAKHDSSW